jgi:hypothetical protein
MLGAEIELIAWQFAPVATVTFRQSRLSMKHEQSIFRSPKLLLAAAITSGFLALGTRVATAQAAIATTPAFSAGNYSYPAGTYQFTILPGWLLSIRNTRDGGQRFLMVLPKWNDLRVPHKGLLFRNVEGHRNLQTVYFAGLDYAVELRTEETASNTTKHQASNKVAEQGATGQ